MSILDDKIVKVNFEEGWDTQFDESLTRGDYGQTLQIKGITLPDGNVEVHFSLTEYDGEAPVSIGTVKDNVITVAIPDFILQKENVTQSSYCAWAWIYVTDGESGQKIRKIEFTIDSRPKATTNVPEDQKDPFLQEVRQVMVETKEIAQSVREDADTGKFNGPQGPQGEPGVIEYIPCKVLPTEDIKNAIYLLKRESAEGEEEEEDNLYDEYIYVNGAWELFGSKPIKLNLEDYVKNDAYASSTVAGVVKTYPSAGISITPSGQIYVNGAKEQLIDKRNDENYTTRFYLPITPALLDYAVMKALSDSKLEWTDEQKKAAASILNVLSLYNLGTGLRIDSKGILQINGGSITEDMIKNKIVNQIALTPSVIDLVVKYGLADSQIEWTDEEKAKALETLGGVASSLVSHPAINGTIVLRGSTGAIFVGEPTSNSHATTKKYVDDGFQPKITEMNSGVISARLITSEGRTNVGIYTGGNNYTEKLLCGSSSGWGLVESSEITRTQLEKQLGDYDEEKGSLQAQIAELRAEIDALKG